MKEIIIYSSPTCPKCNMVKTYLKNKAVEYTEKNIMEAANKKELMAKGFMSIPVLFCGNKTIVGFEPKQMEELLTEGDK